MVIKYAKKIKFGNQISIWDRKAIQIKMDLDNMIENSNKGVSK
jgi:hypothetical protein